MNFNDLIGRETDNTESELILGGTYQNKYISKLFFIDGQTYWIICLDGFSVNDKSLEFQDNATKHDGMFRILCESEINVKIKIGDV
ncbi:36652_t:CDS:2, partial [Gigaspora margarita]